jgi:hypothetical protein
MTLRAHQGFKYCLCFAHFTRLTFSNVTSFSGGGGVIFSLGGVQPYLRHKAWTSAPDDHL